MNPKGQLFDGGKMGVNGGASVRLIFEKGQEHGLTVLVGEREFSERI
jgi:hypothetical protein